MTAQQSGRERRRHANLDAGDHMLEEAARRGLIRWTGQYRNGRKVYEPTDFGRRWAERALAEPNEDTP